MVKVIVAAAAMAIVSHAADPCTDFFQYACGTWYKNAVIPPTQANTDTSFSLLGGKNDLVIQEILKSNKPKLGEFYASCLDTNTLTSLGVKPLADDFSLIKGANSTETLIGASAELSKRGVPAFTLFSVQPDSKDSSVNVLYAAQGALTLSRAYYTDADRWSKIEADYKQYVTSV